MARTDLIKAYEVTIGRIRVYGKERGAVSEIPGVSHLVVNPTEVERFARHGIANVRIPMDSFSSFAFAIDTSELGTSACISQVWLTQSPKRLNVHISNGSNLPKKNATIIDLDKNLQGILINTLQLSRNVTPIPYRAKLIPLYLKKT